MFRDIFRKTFFPIIAYHTVQIRLAVVIDNVSCRHLLSLVHPHIKRRVHPIGKSPVRCVELIRRHAQIDYDTVHTVNSSLLELRLHITIVAPYYRDLLPEAFQTLFCRFYRVSVLVYSYKSPLAAQPAANFKCMSATS